MTQAHRGLSVRSLIVIALVGMVLLGGGIYFGVNYAVERAVAVDAVDKAQHWTDYFLRVMPDLDRLLADGKLTDAQSEVIETAAKVGDVFRFKLYSPSARQVLVSDDAEAADEGDDDESPDHNDTAAAALSVNAPQIELHGEAEAGQPALFVEAYVPARDAAGVTHGVVEVYIDQTGTAALLRSTFAALAVGLAVVAALAFGLPTLAFLFRTRQASEARGKAEFLAHYDPLTGVLNRAAVAERLEVALRQSRLDRSAVTAVLFDVDAFKSINEAHGAGAGDAFLKHVAQALQTPLNADEHCGRQGGDEFVVVLKRRNAVEIAAYVEAVMRAVHRPINVEDQSISGHVSAGVYPVEQGVSPADVLHRADVALYQAKSDGRNTWRLFSPEMEAAMAARRALEQRLREATTGNGFEVFFQPLLKVETEQCAGFEALLRLPDGEGGYIPPAIFIPVAETMGLINEIGAWVLQEATRVAATWPAEFFVAVNLSVRQFGDGKLVEEVRNALAQSGLRAQQLELEVTESMLIDNTEMVGAQLAALKALGVSIAMDDFGTGYSSLGYLWQFGFDKLKIDRSFVAALETDDARARDILDTIISLGHKLEMTVTAEGIETPHQAEVLSQLSADHFQGYLYGRPAPATELAAYLLRSRALGSKSEPAPANRAVI